MVENGQRIGINFIIPIIKRNKIEEEYMKNIQPTS